MAEALVSTILEQLASKEMKLFEGGNEVEKLKENIEAIQDVLEEAEEKQMVDSRVKQWLDKLQGTFYDIEDVLDKWITTAERKSKRKEVENDFNLSEKVRSLIFSHSFGSRQVFLRQIVALRIKKLNETLDEIVKEKDAFNFSLTMSKRVEEEMISIIYLPKVVGKDYDKNTIINQIESSQADSTCHLPIISIVEMLGTEKTTLAQLVVSDDKVKSHFDDIIWVYVHKFFDGIMIAKTILKYLKKDNVALNQNQLETLLGEIHQCLEGKKFLLVLDDVRIKNLKIWKQFKDSLRGSQGSSILLTISTIKTAKMMGSTKMVVLGNEWQSPLSLFRKFEFSEDKMSDVERWSLFSKVVFSTLTCVEREQGSGVFKEIASTSKGLPSIVKILGSLLCSKTNNEQWKSVNNKLIELEKMKTPFPSPLLLSYYELPSKLRKCFLYCAIFPKYFVINKDNLIKPKDFVINKDNLIKLWMAQGYLSVSGRHDMELVGEEYFAILAMSHFFQDFERSVYNGSILRCKLPSIVHDFAKFLMEKECLTLIGQDDHQKSQSEIPYKGARHVMIIANSISISYIHNEKKLRSLVVNKTEIGGELFSLFEELTCLRTLDLSDCSIKEIPENIKNLIHLRYLNLSHNIKIKELPEMLCELYNLQTLDLSNCYRLEKLPRKIGNLINLRHLINHRTCLSYMPRGIKRLTCLQTLKKFVVSDDKINEKGGRLKCLEKLNQLEGLLTITGLGNVSDVNEIYEGKLEDKKNLYGLSLRFDGTTNVDDEGILKSLKSPPPNLEELVIQCYTGKTMPLESINKLGKLRMLKLMSCFAFKDLRDLGKLSSLESLILCNMRGVEKVGNVFLGINIDGSGTSTAFPKLRYLKFLNMIEWEELNWSQSVTIMPCLRYLVFDSCPKLKSLSLLGQLPSLESLVIKRMMSVKKAGDEFLGPSSSSSSAVYTFPKLINLEFEDMSEWEGWNFNWDERTMPNLLSLKFYLCPKLEALPDNLLRRLALQKFIINECSALQENYLKKTGKKWSKISHIPYIQIHSSVYVHGNASSFATMPPEPEHPEDRDREDSS